MGISIVRTIEALLLPPGGPILLILLGFFLVRRLYRTGILMMMGGFVLIIVSSLPITAYGLLHFLEYTPTIPRLEIEKPTAAAIVVIGHGRRLNGNEWHQTEVASPEDIERLRYAAFLQKKTGLPILLSGGVASHADIPESKLMQQVLIESFATRAKWEEDKSKNTWENALFSKEILENQGIDKIILVTHAAHMPRAKLAFHSNGLNVIAAPMGFSPTLTQGLKVRNFIPTAQGLYLTNKALHELLGYGWYQLHYGAEEEEIKYTQFPS